MPALDACCALRVRPENWDVDRIPRTEAVAFGLATGGVLCPAAARVSRTWRPSQGRTSSAIRVLASPGVSLARPRPAPRRSRRCGRPWAGHQPPAGTPPPSTALSRSLIRSALAQRQPNPIRRRGPVAVRRRVRWPWWPPCSCRPAARAPAAAGSRSGTRERTTSLSKGPTEDEVNDNRNLMARWLSPRPTRIPTPTRSTNSPLILGSNGYKPMQAAQEPRGRGRVPGRRAPLPAGEARRGRGRFRQDRQEPQGDALGRKGPVLPRRVPVPARQARQRPRQLREARRRLPRDRVPRQAGRPRVRHRPDLAGLAPTAPSDDAKKKKKGQDKDHDKEKGKDNAKETARTTDPEIQRSLSEAPKPPAPGPAPDLPWYARFTGEQPLLDTHGNAIAALEHVRHHDPTGPLADDAVLQIADEHMNIGDYESAGHLLRPARDRPSQEPVPPARPARGDRRADEGLHRPRVRRLRAGTGPRADQADDGRPSPTGRPATRSSTTPST